VKFPLQLASQHLPFGLRQHAPANRWALDLSLLIGVGAAAIAFTAAPRRRSFVSGLVIIGHRGMLLR